MPRSTEKLALRLMKALKAEFEREPDATKARPVSEVSIKIIKDQEEYDRVITFISPKRMGLINSWKRTDGKLVAQPNDAGFAWIASHKEKWPLQARLTLYAILLTIVIYGAPKILAWLRQ